MAAICRGLGELIGEATNTKNGLMPKERVPFIIWNDSARTAYRILKITGGSVNGAFEIYGHRVDRGFFHLMFFVVKHPVTTVDTVVYSKVYEGNTNIKCDNSSIYLILGDYTTAYIYPLTNSNGMEFCEEPISNWEELKAPRPLSEGSL